MQSSWNMMFGGVAAVEVAKPSVDNLGHRTLRTCATSHLLGERARPYPDCLSEWRQPESPNECVCYLRRMSDDVSIDLLEGVHDRASFLEFVSALARDRREEVEIERATHR
jgi:hypothetical protein